jgi:hypothetical protein
MWALSQCEELLQDALVLRVFPSEAMLAALHDLDTALQRRLIRQAMDLHAPPVSALYAEQICLRCKSCHALGILNMVISFQ